MGWEAPLWKADRLHPCGISARHWFESTLGAGANLSSSSQSPDAQTPSGAPCPDSAVSWELIESLTEQRQWRGKEELIYQSCPLFFQTQCCSALFPSPLTSLHACRLPLPAPSQLANLSGFSARFSGMERRNAA